MELSRAQLARVWLQCAPMGAWARLMSLKEKHGGALGVWENYTPKVVDSGVPGQVRSMRADAGAALKEMFAACKQEAGITLLSVSGYRSYGKQANIYRRKLRRVKGNEAKAQEYVAPPGASEHQLGLAMDIGQKNKSTLTYSFGDTKGGKWARENCWRFGFILRYDAEWEEITGYKYEPWHFRYVGKENARLIHEANIPFETWLADFRTKLLIELMSEPSTEKRVNP